MCIELLFALSWTVDSSTCNWPSMLASLESNSGFWNIVWANKMNWVKRPYSFSSFGLIGLVRCLNVWVIHNKMFCLGITLATKKRTILIRTQAITSFFCCSVKISFKHWTTGAGSAGDRSPISSLQCAATCHFLFGFFPSSVCELFVISLGPLWGRR